jgi:hypothetical protein
VRTLFAAPGAPLSPAPFHGLNVLLHAGTHAPVCPARRLWQTCRVAPPDTRPLSRRHGAGARRGAPLRGAGGARGRGAVRHADRRAHARSAAICHALRCTAALR